MDKRLFFIVLMIFLLIIYYIYVLFPVSMMDFPVSNNGEVLIHGERVIELSEEIAEKVWVSYNRYLSRKPYDPGLFAWGIQYEIRSYVLLYKITNDLKWLLRAVKRCDYLVRYSDVNGDGIPSWGNYNSTYGNDRYASEGYREFSVWDGVISTALLDVSQTILDDPRLRENETLFCRAMEYLDVSRRVVEHYRDAWTSVSDGGYYWDSPREDVVGPIVNRFSALGIAEIKLYEIAGDDSYLERPRAMAMFLKNRLRYVDGCYVWTYRLSVDVTSFKGYEDISHGAIDLEFMLLSYRYGLVFNGTDIERLTCTYTKYIWLGFSFRPHLATRVSGEYTADYVPYSRNWIMLSEVNPVIWLFQWYALNDHDIMYNACYLQGLLQLLSYYPRIGKVIESFVNYTKVIINKGVVKYSLSSFYVESLVDKAIKQFENGDVEEAYRTLIYVNFIVEKVQRYFFVEVVSLLLIILLLFYILVGYLRSEKNV